MRVRVGAPGELPGKRSGPTGNIVELPALVFLTAAGLRFCTAKGIPVRDIRSREGFRAEGLAWSRFTTEALQRLVAGGFLSAIEISRTELVTSRKWILATVEAIVSSVIGRRNDAAARGKATADRAGTARRAGSGEEVAEHLAILAMEFVQAAELGYLKRLASKDPLARNKAAGVDSLLAQPSFRERLIEHAARRGESMVLRVEVEPAAVRVSIRSRGLAGCQEGDDFARPGPGSVYRESLARSCAEAGIGFGHRILPDRGGGTTVSTISLSV